MEFKCPFFTDSWCREETAQDVVSSKQGVLFRCFLFVFCCLFFLLFVLSPLLLRLPNLGLCLCRLNNPSCHPGSLPLYLASDLLLQSWIWGKRGELERCCPWSLQWRQQATRPQLWVLVAAQTPGEHDWRCGQDLGERWVLLTAVRGLGAPRGWMLALVRWLPALASRPAWRGGTGFLRTKGTCKKKVSSLGHGRRSTRGPLGVLGRRVSPFPLWANPPPCIPLRPQGAPPQGLSQRAWSASTAWGSAPTRTGRAWSSRPKASGEKQGRPRRRVGTSDIWGALVRFQRLSVPFFWGKVNKRLAKDRFLRVPSWNAETGLCRRLLGQLRVNWMMAQWAGSSPRACEEGHHGGYRGLLWLLCPV